MNDDDQTSILREIRDLIRQQATIAKDRWEQYQARADKQQADWEGRRAILEKQAAEWESRQAEWQKAQRRGQVLAWITLFAFASAMVVGLVVVGLLAS